MRSNPHNESVPSTMPGLPEPTQNQKQEAMLIVDELRHKPSHNSIFFTYMDRSGTMTETFLLTIRTSWRDAHPGCSDSL